MVYTYLIVYNPLRRNIGNAKSLHESCYQRSQVATDGQK